MDEAMMDDDDDDDDVVVMMKTMMIMIMTSVFVPFFLDKKMALGLVVVKLERLFTWMLAF